MKHSRALLLIMMILPWFSLPFLGKAALKRYSFTAVFMSFIVIIESYIARKRTWWWIYKNLFPKIIGEVPLILGPFLIGALWILKLSYKNLPLYVFLNSLIHFLFAYPLMDWFKKVGLGSIVRLKRYQLMLLFFSKALVMYFIQAIADRYVLKKTKKGDHIDNFKKTKNAPSY